MAKQYRTKLEKRTEARVVTVTQPSTLTRRSTFGARAFAIAGPTVWNSLLDSLRDPAVGPDQFRRDLTRAQLLPRMADRLCLHRRCVEYLATGNFYLLA